MNPSLNNMTHTVCPRSPDPLNILIYYINSVKTSWTYSVYIENTTNDIEEKCNVTCINLLRNS